MAVDIGPKIGIEGEAQFRREIQQTNAALKTMAAEGKAVASAFDSEADAEKKVAAQKDVLNRQIEAQKKKLELLEKGLHDATQMYGPADEKTQKWAQAVYEATAKLNGMEHELSDMDNAVADTADNMEAAGDAAQGWADVMKGQLLADAIKTGLSKMAGLVKDASKAMWEASQAGAAYADDLLTMATTTGMSTKNLQEYKYMADLIDVSLDTLTGSMTKLTSNMSKAAKGNKDAVATFEDLGVAITDNNGQLRSTEDVFNDVVSALGKIDNETERDAKAMDVFGKSAKDLNPLIEAGADKLRDLAKEANETGYVLSGDALDALGAQQDAMDRLDKKTEALKNSFAVKLAPSMERAYNTMGEVFDNPRVKQGLDVLATGVGSVIEGATNLAAKVLPDLLSLLAPLDDRLKYLTDDQLELVRNVDESRQAHEEMVDSFKSRAQDIVAETERTEDLWKELQTLVGENGEVKKKDEERVKYITGELKDALGIQLELENGILKGYQEQQKEIDKLIKKQEAEALIAAGKEEFAEAEKERNKALANAAKLAPDYEKKLRDLERAQRDYAKAVDYANRMNDAGVWSDDRALKYIDDYLGKVNDAQGAFDTIAAEYNDAREEAQKYYADVDKWQRAQTAAANENYGEVIRILTGEFGVTMDYYRQKKQLSDQDKKDLRAKISEQELVIEEYKRNLQKGLTGFSESGLAEMQEYVKQAKDILNGKSVAESYLNGIILGLESDVLLAKIAARAAHAARTVDRSARWELQIASPSKKAMWIGRMWDEGLIEGMEAHEAELAKAATSLADTIETSGAPSGDLAYGYGNGLTASGAGYGTTSNAYTTNLGGITVRIDGAGDVDADVLAQRVAVRLTDELRRAQRGGRA